ncbi:AP-3 complex subunit mu-1 [Grifola frondosa]|uniref:AP-3 complex subunit mu-1 n=1 Tax=Grifola frondosa TaxID=5627 RepID=A0A1C7M541_GRIFR|nr:AP-3 complex subunit mu-1 [Grifola frondosa]
MSAAAVVKLIPGRTVFFVCDIQTRFRTAIHGFEQVVSTANKMLKLANILNVPVVATEQNSRALGHTVPELDLTRLGPLYLGTIEKTLFSMATPDVQSLLKSRDLKSVVLFGIESHVCVLQSALDLLELGYDVHVLADGVSSCNPEEVPYALARMRQAGAQITTSESAAFQLQGDSTKPNFKQFSAAIKEEKENTEKNLQVLLRHRSLFLREYTMAIDGLIILDSAGQPVVQSGFRSSPQAYALLHIDALNSALAAAARPDDVDPVLAVPGAPLSAPSACCHLRRDDLHFVCPVSGDVDPLYAFAFLQTFIDILHEYFGQISAETLKENFDIVYQLLEETLDSGGHPLTTSTNTLRDIVLPPSFLHKVLSVAGVSGLASSSANSHPFASPIPWRKAGVRYNSNEIYFDVVETLEAIVNKNGTPVASTVWVGSTQIASSQVGDLIRCHCSFHPCVRLQRWARDKTLSFVPPDGRFKLMEYRFAPASTSSLHQMSVPFTLRADAKVEEHGGNLDLTFTSRLTTRALENVSIELYLGEGASGASCIVSHNASWSFNPRTLTLRWELRNVPPSSSCTLRGSFTSAMKIPRPSRAFRVRFEIVQHSFSALKIDQLKLTGEQYKPYKGIRGKSTGDVEWRW